MTKRAQKIMEAFYEPVNRSLHYYDKFSVANVVREISSIIHRDGVLEDEPWHLHIADELNEIVDELEAL